MHIKYADSRNAFANKREGLYMKRLKKALPVLCFLLVVTIISIIFYFYTISGKFYDYQHLIPITQDVESTPFVPIDRDDVPGMIAAAETDYLVLYFNPLSGGIAVYDKRNSHTWYSNPLQSGECSIANTFEQNVMASTLIFQYYNERRVASTYWSSRDSAELEQMYFYTIPGGVRMYMTLGTTTLGIRGIPRVISDERLDYFMDRLEPDDRLSVTQHFARIRRMPGFRQMHGNVLHSRQQREEVVRGFELAGYTFEDLLYDNYLAGSETDISLDVFRMHVDFILEGDTLTINIPTSEIEPERIENQLRGLELMRYFGAGSYEEDGYIFVPSGSGALIEFNNGKIAHEPYVAVVYGIDILTTIFKPQISNNVRLPVFGIQREDAAFLAHIINGSALATIQADVSGRVSSFNTAWFSFTMRESDVTIVHETSMNIIQEPIYTGDITVQYIFLAGDDACYVGMANAYQQYLVETGVLTPLPEIENAPFYLSILSAIEKREHLLGAPYNSTVAMTTYSQGQSIVETLNSYGVDAIQMQWLGWFNRGVNHDVATSINPIRRVGSMDDRSNLIDALETGGGGFYPAVRFQSIRRDSRGLRMTSDVSRMLLGFSGFYTSFGREWLSIRYTYYMSDVFALINPLALPFHVDAFIPEFHRHGTSSIALTDLGDTISQSMHRRNGIDRESSKLIAASQIQRLYNEWDNIMVSGGNDYSLFAARHVIDVPLHADRFYILDHSIPFTQMVMRGFIEFCSTPINAHDVHDQTLLLLQMLATGSAPHFKWTYEPMLLMSFTQYERYYSTHYQTWLETAVNMYHIFNEVFDGMHNAPITDFVILCPGIDGSIGRTAVTMTEFGGSVRVYVNTSDYEFIIDDILIGPRDFWVER